MEAIEDVSITSGATSTSEEFNDNSNHVQQSDKQISEDSENSSANFMKKSEYLDKESEEFICVQRVSYSLKAPLLWL